MILGAAGRGSEEVRKVQGLNPGPQGVEEPALHQSCEPSLQWGHFFVFMLTEKKLSIMQKFKIL